VSFAALQILLKENRHVAFNTYWKFDTFLTH
jgi:hypothetical protein